MKKQTRRRKGRQSNVPLTAHEKTLLALYRALPRVRDAVDLSVSAAWCGPEASRASDDDRRLFAEMGKLRMDYCSSGPLIYFVNVHNAEWREHYAVALGDVL